MLTLALVRGEFRGLSITFSILQENHYRPSKWSEVFLRTIYYPLGLTHRVYNNNNNNNNTTTVLVVANLTNKYVMLISHLRLTVWLSGNPQHFWAFPWYVITLRIPNNLYIGYLPTLKYQSSFKTIWTIPFWIYEHFKDIQKNSLDIRQL